MASLALSSKTVGTFGEDRFVTARFLYKGETEPITWSFEHLGLPLDITNFTFSFRMQKQQVDTAKDTKNGFDITGRIPYPNSTELNLDSYVTVQDAVNGKLLIELPAELTAEGEDEYGLPTIYTGFLTAEDNASLGELIQKFPFCVVVK